MDEYWTMGGQLAILREAVQRMADDPGAQIRYLEARQIDGDELWNELGDALVVSLGNLGPRDVLSAHTTEALASLKSSATDLFDQGLWRDDDIRTHPLWVRSRELATRALRLLDADSGSGQAPWLRRLFLHPGS